MVIAPAFAFLAILSLAQVEATEREPSSEVGSALGKTAFPWYDVSKDQARPMALPAEPTVSGTGSSSSTTSSSGGWTIRGVGDLLAILAFAVGLAALIGLLAWFWRLYEPVDANDRPGSSKRSGDPSKVEALPPGMRREFESADPWEEAIRRRERGDLAGAVVCLFAHQLLTLSRLGLVRLAPGKTGRQLLRSVADAEFRGLAQPTLRLFESVYYGHREPTPEEFARVWEQAEAFERRVAGGVVA